MLAVAENGGRIRPQVSLVKALASALCIGGGGSVGREGPIVQIGSAFASTLGQLVRMSEGRMRVIVACGAAGGISATFNAPVTGLFFGFEIVLKEFSAEALAATILSAVTADLISRAFFGSAAFFASVPARPGDHQRPQLPADRPARSDRGRDRRAVSEDPLQGRGRRRCDLAAAAAMAAAGRGRVPAGRSAAGFCRRCTASATP